MRDLGVEITKPCGANYDVVHCAGARVNVREHFYLH